MSGSTLASHQHCSFSFTLPPSSLLSFAPAKNPAPLSPPVRERSLAYPFSIDSQVYHNALSVFWPIAIASVYCIAITWWNRLNTRRNHKPWAFSQTSKFFWLVIVHNVFLALYSFWTFSGMVRAIRHAWPGLRNEYGTAGVLDSLCKIHGPRGQGSAATYSSANKNWSNRDIVMRLQGGLPDSTDVGRIWNEGLAYYGWLFYLSKFYEVVDSVIILTKGKNTSFLQTYHHTGAMFAMWAGIRYMSPPIWMFTCINSFIHTLMYTYYVLVALQIRVHPRAKRALTSAQIFQIIFGASYAFAHLFIAYDVPVNTPYRVFNSLSTALPGAFNSATSFAASATSAADFGSLLKKAALRAAGEGGLAANVRNAEGQVFGLDAVHSAGAERAQKEIIYRSTTTRTHCLDTSGEAFAIVLNLFYLVPLAYLFIGFFAQYFRKDQSSGRESANKAIKNVAGEVVQAMGDQQGGATVPPEHLKAQIEDTKEGAVKLEESTRKQAQDLKQKAQKNFQAAGPNAKQATGKAKDKASEIFAAMQDTLLDKEKKADKTAPSKPVNDDKGSKSNEDGPDARVRNDVPQDVKKEDGEGQKDDEKKEKQPNGV